MKIREINVPVRRQAMILAKIRTFQLSFVINTQHDIVVERRGIDHHTVPKENGTLNTNGM